MSKDEVLSPLKWLEKRIEYTIESKGRVNGFYAEYKQNPQIVSSADGTYSWLDYLVGELLQVYRLLKVHEETDELQSKRWRKLIGLAENANTEEVEARLSEMGEYFLEVEKSWQIRKKKGSDAINP